MKKSLTEREKEVAILISRGMKDVEIAYSLFISRRRVGVIIASIKEKWGIRSRVEIGIGVYKKGWMENIHSTLRENKQIS
ncbi:helix-turn-helix transcriptional regulator [Cytobacillus sp. IB215316]|uniref:response regulator transcription factor n=1 Tax=Cytobacillus sp. IB215316 TaxID=3097354 RepID=UPI002A1700BF|nr:helix-turn-helix transcriptional regulator [Cytobacillus sp. IB215316]MDX8361510.1 helix-turn-helix transcriptional regulator [Cytobacillus sp. IB215316]